MDGDQDRDEHRDEHRDDGRNMRGDGDDASLLRARLSAIVDTTLDPLLLVRPVHDADGRVVDFVVADMNGSHTRAGGDRSTSTRMHLPERAPALLDLYRRVLRSGSTESVRRVWVDAHPQDPTSTAGWADVRATGVAGDVVVSWRNVDDDVAGEDVLRRQAMQDPLTLLPNRRALLELLSAACTSAAPFGVLFVDVDRFKSINDRHGHGVGDAVLVETGRRLAGALRSTDIVGRLAGDEFVVLARPLADRGELRSLAARLLATGEHPQRVGDHDVQVSVSVGGVWVGDGRRDVTSILHEADTLMYIAKRRGGGALLLSEAPPE